MVTRRTILVNAIQLPIIGLLLPKLGQATTAFDFYIGPTGNDSNPGSQAQPWSITALNTKRSTYAGKKVGLLDGTYDVSALPGTANTVKLALPSGTSSTSPTVIQAVNPRQAVLTSKVGSNYFGPAIIGSGANGTGTNPQIQYITIKDLTIAGCDGAAVSFACDSGAKTCPGLIIDGCHISDCVNTTNGATNVGGIALGTGPDGCIIQNCLIHDCFQIGLSRTSHGNSAAIYDWGNNTVIQYCTLYGCNNLIYQKNQGVNPPPQGATIRNNYMWAGTSGSGPALAGFNNAGGTSPPYAPTNIYNNIFEDLQLYYQSNGGVDALQADLNFFNNTVYSRAGTSSMGYWIQANPNVATVRVYNNILVRKTVDSARGDLTIGPSYGGSGIYDYNRYPVDAKFGLGAKASAYPNLISLAQWQAVAGTPDIHSVTGDPAFVGPLIAGSGPNQYRLQSASPCKLVGRIGGISTGTTVDMGVWGGGATQIGHNFSLVPIPAPVAPAPVTVTVS
jgi:hypothetical protein